MGGIGIVGTGISGLQLALYLQGEGVDTTVYSPRSLAGHRTGRLPNCVVRWAPTIERERQLGVFHWERNAMAGMTIRVAGDAPLVFHGSVSEPANTTDFRIYLPGLYEDYETRGGRVVVGPVEPGDLTRLAARHDLLVVAAGRDGFGGVFPGDPVRSVHRAPPRYIAAGLYEGVTRPEPAGIDFTVVPGGGEILQIPFHSFDGPVTALAVNAVPGGPLDQLSALRYEDDPARFEATLLALLETFAPSVRERVHRAAFRLTRPDDLLQGRLLPVVRRAWAPLDGGAHAVAIGDAWILNDPVAAQGANLGSRCAFVLGEAITGGGPYDEPFCRRMDAALWAAASAPTALSNALLEPPTEAVVDVLFRACGDPATADRFVSGFGDPEDMLALLAGERASCVP